MKLLALDTSSDACSAAVLTDTACFSQFEMTPRAHTRLILPMIAAVLQQADLRLADVDALAFGRGPGSFTGVRISAGIVQGLALAVDKPVIAISTLAALAQQAYQQLGVIQALVALDARMGEVYWGAYRFSAGRMQLQGVEALWSPGAVPIPQERGWQGVGSGWLAHESVLRQRLSHTLNYPTYADLLPAAMYIAQLAVFDWQAGHITAPEYAQPVYLRNKVAQTIVERAGLSG